MSLRHAHRRDPQKALQVCLRELGREPCMLRLPAADGSTQARGPAGKRKADLPAIPREGLIVRKRVASPGKVDDHS
jgi:hypothetical protein